MTGDVLGVVLAFTLCGGFLAACFLAVKGLVGYACWPKCPGCGRPLVWSRVAREYRRCRCWFANDDV